MGWVKKPIQTTTEIFSDIVNNIGQWHGTPKGNSTPYEYFSDLIRDNYDVTLTQCNEICIMLKEHFNITDFYAI